MSGFEKLLAQHKSALERYVCYHISDKFAREDIMQEIMLAAFTRFDSLCDPASFKAWLLGIARNKCMDHYRRRSAEISLEEVSEKELVQSRYGVVEFSPVQETIELLSAKDRQILKLYYFENLSQRMISEKLNIPLGTVKSRLSAAKSNFKKHYPYKPKNVKEDDPMSVIKNSKREVIKPRLPDVMPEYVISPSAKEPFTVKWEEIMGWFIVPKFGEKLCWAAYDLPQRSRAEYVEMSADSYAEIHGIKGVLINIRQYGGAGSDSADASEYTERALVAQLTDTHCRLLAESHESDGVKKFYTFLDGDDFLVNWGFGEDNCGNEINIAAKGDITVTDNIVTCKDKPFLLDVVGRYDVTVNGRTFDTICVMDIETYNNGVVSEQYIDKHGRTVLWRRFNRNDWAFDRYGKLWSELLPDNETKLVNGETYVHWYDCMTDYIF